MKSPRLNKNKIWPKLITYIVITTFLSQNIAWARGISSYTNQNIENKLSANTKVSELVNEWNILSLMLAIYDMYGFGEYNRITVNKIDSAEEIRRRLRNNLIKNDNLGKYREYVDRIKDVSLGEDGLIYVKYLEGDSELLLRFYRGDKVDDYTVLSESEDIINGYKLQVVIDDKRKDFEEEMGKIVRDGNREVEYRPGTVESTGQKNVVSENTFQANFLERIAEILLVALLVVVRGVIALLRRRSGRNTMIILMLIGLLMAPAGVALAQEGSDAILIETSEFIPSEEGSLLEAIAPKRIEVHQKGGSVIGRYYSSSNDLIWERETYYDGQIGAEYRDEKGNPIGIEYLDENGNLVLETLDEGKVIGAEHWDENGNLIGIEYMDENGDLIFESYDKQDNLIDEDSDEKPGFVQEDQIARERRQLVERIRRLDTGVAKRREERQVQSSDDTSQKGGRREIVNEGKNTSFKNRIILYLITLSILVISSCMFLIKRKSENKSIAGKKTKYREETCPSRGGFLKWLDVAGILTAYEHYFGRVVHASTKEEVIPSRVEIKQDPDGYRLYVNGQKTDGVTGMGYQPVPADMHINDFVKRYGYSGLYKALLDKEEGGQGHGKILKDMGVKAIRIYELGTDNSEDVAKVKEIFRRLKRDYGIMVMVGTYAGLYKHPNDKQAVKREVERMVEVYSGEPWLLAWQIGNENERYLKDRDLARYVRQPINMTEKEYYDFMDELAGVTKMAESKKAISHPIIFGHSDPGHNEDAVRSIMKMRNIDAVGLNAYRDSEGFNDLFIMFKRLEGETKRKLPIIISEFGQAVYRRPEQNISKQQAEQEQLEYNTRVWRTIRNNTAGRAGLGNVLGGFCFIFTDQLYRLKELPPDEWYQAYYGIVDRPSQDMFKIVECQQVTVRGDESSEELMLKAWESLENQQFDVAINAAEIIIRRHEEKAKKEQVEKEKRIRRGDNFRYISGDEATKKKIQSFGSLNMTGAAYFIMGKAYKGKRQYTKAEGYFEKVIKEYPLAEIWDRGGWFWKPADAAKKELGNLKFLIPLIPLTLGRDSADASDTEGRGKTKAKHGDSQDTSLSHSKFDKFKNTLRNLRNKMEDILKTTLDAEVTDYNPTHTQSLILYAEPLLDNCGIIDLEIIRAMVENNILGSVVLYAEDEKNNIILEELLREVSPVVKIIKITKSRLNERFRYNNDEADEIDALVRFVGTKGINPKDILGVIKGFSENQTEIGRLSETLKVPIVILKKTAGEAIYSFTQAVLRTIAAKRGESGWFIILPPIKIITEELQREWEEYKASLQILRAA